ncbi:hypothetical protein L917_02410 [Phytophthora nicotianae]|uniref:Uncharacterized protein n=1 Tax=Phytophthora nicotianae TaxID=4792 RepID=W2LW73_PHYNI|nr:hypothetical protein L917_02410 [Phytophthora nicotianae]
MSGRVPPPRRSASPSTHCECTSSSVSSRSCVW